MNGNMKSGLIIVEGNIGAGKSTFAKTLAESLGGIYIAEPDETSNPYLADYYADPARYAFNIQMYLLSRRYRAHLDAQTAVRNRGSRFFVMDRSYYGDVCFANVQHQLGYFDDRDYTTYLSHHADMKVHVEPPAAAIFLNADPVVCKARISQRMSEKAGRRCESSIELDYLARLGHEIDALRHSLEGKTLVKSLDWNEDKSPLDIKCRCNEIAVELKVRDASVYDFWTGTNGIGA